MDAHLSVKGVIFIEVIPSTQKVVGKDPAEVVFRAIDRNSDKTLALGPGLNKHECYVAQIPGQALAEWVVLIGSQEFGLPLKSIQGLERLGKLKATGQDGLPYFDD